MPAFARRARFVGLCFSSGLAVAGGAPAAVVFEVDSVADQIDDDVADGLCHTAAGTCTLRAAVMQANQMSGDGATIVLPSGTYLLTRPAIPPLGDDDGDLDLTSPNSGNPSIAISGSGAATTIIDANQIDRVLEVETLRTATISGVALRNGSAEFGGGIVNSGTLTVSHCKLSGNEADTNGGGILNVDTLTLIHSDLSANIAGVGGGLFNSGSADVSHSTIAGNTANSGGGVYNGGALFVTNSTVSSNYSYENGGGIYNDCCFGTTNIYNSTIAGNQADTLEKQGRGGGFYNVGPAFNLRNSVVAGNYRYVEHLPVYDDCHGVLGSYGQNMFSTFDLCDFSIHFPGFIFLIGSLAELGPLQFNGGSTRTHALVAPSDLIDGAEPTEGCRDKNFFLLNTDQRDGARVAGLRCDIGSYEAGSLPANLIFADDFELGNLWAWG